MNNQHAFLIIDAQYDFCHPDGALFVPGAAEDMQRLKQLLLDNLSAIDYVAVTLDMHPVNDISHPSFWVDAAGNFPPPFTQITANDVKMDKWTPRFHPGAAVRYLEALETQQQFLHFIWPEHCLVGSKGASLDENVMEAIHAWALQTGKEYQAIAKGTYPLTEHFGIFQAQIPVPGVPETQLNRQLLDTLNQFEHVYIAGEARSHCVATSIRQVMEFAPELASKMIIIEDCMSDVTGLGHLGEPIYAEARRKGLQYIHAAEVKL